MTSLRPTAGQQQQQKQQSEITWISLRLESARLMNTQVICMNYILFLAIYLFCYYYKVIL